MRSGWNSSKSSSFSPVEANTIGLPTTSLTDSRAAARVAVELGQDHAVESSVWWNASATPTASWPVMASITRKV